MNTEEWKLSLVEKIKAIEDSYRDLGVHMRAGYDIDCDSDEITAFLVIKLARLNSDIEEIFS